LYRRFNTRFAREKIESRHSDNGQSQNSGQTQNSFLVHLKCSLYLVWYRDLTALSIKVHNSRTAALKVHRKITTATIARVGFIHALINPTTSMMRLNQIRFTGLCKPACLRP